MTNEELVNKAIDELKVICHQADEYQKSKGYPVSVTSEEIVRHKLQDLIARVLEQTAHSLLSEVQECAGYGEVGTNEYITKKQVETIIERVIGLLSV